MSEAPLASLLSPLLSSLLKAGFQLDPPGELAALLGEGLPIGAHYRNARADLHVGFGHIFGPFGYDRAGLLLADRSLPADRYVEVGFDLSPHDARKFELLLSVLLAHQHTLQFSTLPALLDRLAPIVGPLRWEHQEQLLALIEPDALDPMPYSWPVL